MDTIYDVVIVGSGPAGLAAALYAKERGLGCLVIERGSIANTIRGYPLSRVLFSTPEEVELSNGGLKRGVKPTREDVLEHYTGIAASKNIDIHTNENVERVIKHNGGFSLDTSKDSYKAAAVLLAIGGFGRPRRLNVSGETSSLISYQFVEAHPYAGKSVLVIGSGNSAAEAALALAEADAKVALSFRQSSLDGSGEANQDASAATTITSKVKPWVREPLELATSEGKIEIIPASTLILVSPGLAVLKARRGDVDELIELKCDHIFALIGADPDTHLLEEAGALIAEDGRPVYDPLTYETTVPGLYVAGHITRDLHMKNAMPVARRVVDCIASRFLASSSGA